MKKTKRSGRDDLVTAVIFGITESDISKLEKMFPDHVVSKTLNLEGDYQLDENPSFVFDTI